jgi:translation initiation factor 1
MPPKKTESASRLLYSTEHGTMCPDCRHPKSQCVCRSQNAPPKSEGPARVRLETKGRKGKGVTLVENAPLPAPELEKLGKRLKQLCGSGGTVKEGLIEIQGDHRERITTELTRLGWKIKRIGF